MIGSKWVVHWTSETWCEWCEIAGSPQGFPPSSRLSVVKLEGGPAANVKPGQKSCVIKSIKSASTLLAWSLVKHPLKGDGAAGLHIVGTEPSEAPTEGHRSQWSELCQGHQCSETTLTWESWFHASTPMGIWTQVPHDGKQTGSPLDQWDMVWMKWDYRLSTSRLLISTCQSVRGGRFFSRLNRTAGSAAIFSYEQWKIYPESFGKRKVQH